MSTLVYCQITALTLSLVLSQFNVNETNLPSEKEKLRTIQETDIYGKDITITLGNITDTVATIKDLKKVKSLVVHLPGEVAKKSADFQIESYNLSYFENNEWTDIYTQGAAVTTEMMKVIKRTKPGDKIYFERIILKCSDGASRKMQGIKVRVI